MKTTLENFLILFSRLQKETNCSPKNLNWFPAEKPSLYGLCYDLNSCFREISRLFIEKSTKHAIVPPSFSRKWNDYKKSWESAVAEAAKIEEERISQIHLAWIAEALGDGDPGMKFVLDKGITEDRFWDYYREKSKNEDEETFNPLSDNPATIMNELYSQLRNLVENDYSDGLINNKHLEAWDFFTDTICIDYSITYARWRNAPELFISPIMLKRDITPIEELYNEAVRAYVFGLTEASVAMCRALMEHILDRYYNCSEKYLANKISSAEERHVQLKSLNLRYWKKSADNVLHTYEKHGKKGEKVALGFLQTIRNLVISIRSP